MNTIKEMIQDLKEAFAPLQPKHYIGIVLTMFLLWLCVSVLILVGSGCGPNKPFWSGLEFGLYANDTSNYVTIALKETYAHYYVECEPADIIVATAKLYINNVYDSEMPIFSTNGFNSFKITIYYIGTYRLDIYDIQNNLLLTNWFTSV